MRRTLIRIILSLVSLLVIISVVIIGLGFYTARSTFPQVEGEIQVTGLDSPVEVYRDEYGVPHIYAINDHDLFFTQGYVHAQDRFWQMDFWRHIGSGRLSELFGESSIETDIFLRTLGWERVAQEEINALDPESLAILEAYAKASMPT